MAFYSPRLEWVYLTPLLVSGELGDGMDAPSPTHGHKYTVCMPTRDDDGHGMEPSPSVQQDQNAGVGAHTCSCREDPHVCKAKERHQAFRLQKTKLRTAFKSRQPQASCPQPVGDSVWSPAPSPLQPHPIYG